MSGMFFFLKKKKTLRVQFLNGFSILVVTLVIQKKKL
jgi:hypothetical protein